MLIANLSPPLIIGLCGWMVLIIEIMMFNHFEQPTTPKLWTITTIIVIISTASFTIYYLLPIPHL